MGEEKAEEQVAVPAITVESQLEVDKVAGTTDGTAMHKRDREAGAETDENNTVKKLKTDEDAKANDESVNGEKDATAKEEKVAESDTASKAESDKALTATETTDEETRDKVEKDAAVDSKASEPTALLNSTTTFKGGFGSFTNSGFGTATSSPATTSVFSSASNSTTSTGNNGTDTTSAFSSAANAFKGGFSGFSSSSSFSSEKKDNPWAESKVLPKSTVKSIFSKEESSSTEESKSEEPAASEELYVQLSAPLTEKKVETGEELEESTFSCRAKLYALDLTSTDKSWKERGVGTLHVNTSKKTSEISGAGDNDNATKTTTTSRLVMRSDGLLRVVLNVPLLKSFEVFKGMKSSLQSEKFIRITAIENGKPIQYALKTANADTSDKLYNAIQQLI